MRTDNRRGVRGARPSETAQLLSSLLLPTVARGAIVRRPFWEGVATATGTDRRLVTTLRELRERHGDDPLPLNLTGRRVAFVLAPEDVRRVLEQTPEPFSPGGAEKEGALGHFQPHGALVSEHEDRPARRSANEQALALGQTIHPDAGMIAAQAEEEARALVVALRNTGSHGGTLDWPRFAETFDALARRVVFGSFAAGDRRTTELLRGLRARANWSYLIPADRTARERFLDRVRENIRYAEPGSLAAALGEPGSGQRPEDQVAHWLFAFDAAAIAAFRALALLTSASAEADSARTEAETEDGLDLPLLRATLRESVRLWPTTLVVIRESTEETEWRDGAIEAGTAFLVMSSYFQRDSARLPYADTFDPRIWFDGRADDEPGLLPFSYGPAGCPGRDLVPLTVSLFLRTLLQGGALHRVDAAAPLPATGLPASLNHFTLRFRYLGD